MFTNDHRLALIRRLFETLEDQEQASISELQKVMDDEFDEGLLLADFGGLDEKDIELDGEGNLVHPENIDSNADEPGEREERPGDVHVFTMEIINELVSLNEIEYVDADTLKIVDGFDWGRIYYPGGPATR